MTRDWSDTSGFPLDPTPEEVRENIRQMAEVVVANCRIVSTLQSIEALHHFYEANAVLGRLIFERSTLLRAGNGANKLHDWVHDRE